MALEQRLQTNLRDTDPILSWIPSFSGDVVSRFRRGVDDKTPWDREKGRRWSKLGLEFGERVLVRVVAGRRGGLVGNYT